MVAATLTTGAGEATARTCHPYPDVNSSNAHCDDIAWLAGTGITHGYTDGSFRPNQPVSRGTMAAFFFRLSHPGETAADCARSPFPDVVADHALCGDIAWLAGTGITRGYTDGSFRPDQPVSRGTMAAFLYRLAGPSNTAPACVARPFTDVATGDAFCGAISWLTYHGIAHGLGTGARYGDTQPLSRETMAAFLHRIAAALDGVGVSGFASAATISGKSGLGAMPRGYAAFDTMFIRLLNAVRSEHGLRALHPSSKVAKIAMHWSRYMANGGTNGKLAHNPDYFDKLGSVAPSWTAAGENVARFSAGAFSPSQVLTAYMNSPGHRANILNAKYRYIGLRTAAGSGAAFNTMDFSNAVT